MGMIQEMLERRRVRKEAYKKAYSQEKKKVSSQKIKDAKLSGARAGIMKARGKSSYGLKNVSGNAKKAGKMAVGFIKGLDAGMEAIVPRDKGRKRSSRTSQRRKNSYDDGIGMGTPRISESFMGSPSRSPRKTKRKSKNKYVVVDGKAYKMGGKKKKSKKRTKQPNAFDGWEM